MPVLTVLLVALVTRLRGADPERGDVPGWVMITVMTAGLVVGITAIAGPALQDMVSSALNKVK